MKSNQWLLILSMILYFLIPQSGFAQERLLSVTEQENLIQKIATELKDRYVFLEVAEKTAAHLESLEVKGESDVAGFMKRVNEEIYRLTKDKHISVSLKEKQPEGTVSDPLAQWMASRLEERTFFRRYNANFKSVSKLEGNIGYLDLRGFYGLDFGREFADGAMGMLATSDAIIIDLRNNSGGRGDMVDYLLSYFFEETIITGKSRKRRGDSFVDRTHKTPKRTSGRIIGDTPLFILTSATTFSAAEAFSYPLKVYKRATFVGETTKGGANAGDLISLDEDLQIFIPDVAGLPHPVSGEIFEGIGILPDVEVESEKALEVAMEKAKEAAKEYRTRMDAQAREMLLALNKTVEAYDGKDEHVIVEAYLACRAHDLIFEEWELNSLGYQLLGGDNLPTALAVFKTNTVLYPHSANTFDSYAEALLKNGNVEKAIASYEQAIAKAKLNEDGSLAMFEANLAKAKELLSKHP
ncbi:MAG: S41 family peptidase [Bacteroidota bacterium]